ncbi:hypothetical protein [Tenacibaculum piscium]|uniref:hypothetical protein n=1 Tax=Tenacibaculum piscium TaxID=1458515 RepID=UPI001F36078F|nr:hypothetical protein [Tenacibaculum piscium]
MIKIYLLALFFLATTFKLSAQNNDNNDSYLEFSASQITAALKISKEKISNKEISNFSFNKGVEYQGQNFWSVATKNQETYYFNSSKNFEKVTHTKENYNSLMEYIIEQSDF